MKSEMAAGEIAAYLEKTSKEEDFLADGKNPRVPYLNAAASILRRVASGELAEVVHAHWIPVAKECYDITDDEQYPAYKYCSHCKISQKWPDYFNRCPNCGADMRQTQGGKDDSHETD